jgi:hypothetical protein
MKFRRPEALKNRWAEPPSEMIDDLLLRELRMSGHYQNVYFLRSDVSGDYVREVDGEVLAARVAFEFDLRNIKTGVTVWSHYYLHDEPVNRRDVTAVDKDWGNYAGMEFMATHPPAGGPTLKSVRPEKFWSQRPRAIEV